jgi:hypothetical protein
MTSSDALPVQHGGLRRTGGRGDLAPTGAVVILEGNQEGEVTSRLRVLFRVCAAQHRLFDISTKMI